MAKSPEMSDFIAHVAQTILCLQLRLKGGEDGNPEGGGPTVNQNSEGVGRYGGKYYRPPTHHMAHGQEELQGSTNGTRSYANEF